MLKLSVKYTDFNDVEREEDAYFNLSKTEILNNPGLLERFESIQKELSNKETFEEKEMRILLDLTKDLMELSHGVKSDDGRRFEKTYDTWLDFSQSAAYDELLLSMFVEPQKVLDFLFGIFPQDLITQAMEEHDISPEQLLVQPIEAGVKNVDEASLPSFDEKIDHPVPVAPVVVTENDNRPLYQQENREPTQDELMRMTRHELVLAMQWKTNK